MAEEIAGIAFPFRIDPATGRVAMAVDNDKLRQNVRLILGTRLGERPMLRTFGTRLAALVHEVNDDVLADLAQGQARDALLQWEPRVLVDSTRIEQIEGELRLWVNYVRVNHALGDQLVLPLT